LHETDGDEIPRPETVQLLKNYDVPLPAAFHMPMYYISFEYYSKEREWTHSNAVIYDNNVKAQDLRGHPETKAVILKQAGWCEH
jgi:hypothetical protein